MAPEAPGTANEMATGDGASKAGRGWILEKECPSQKMPALTATLSKKAKDGGTPQRAVCSTQGLVEHCFAGVLCRGRRGCGRDWS